MNNKNQLLVVLALATTSVHAIPVYADAISPKIKDTGNVYSKEPANTGYFGNGVGGRGAEAMTLRFEVERMLQDGELEPAIAKAKKACQLDPSDPTCHVLLARALSRHFYSKDGPVDEKLLKECLAEWKLIWFHDSDQWEQMEAKQEARRMMKIAKNLLKKKEVEAQERLAAKQDVAKHGQIADKGSELKPAPEKSGKGTQEKVSDAESQEAVSIASKKRRFLLF